MAEDRESSSENDEIQEESPVSQDEEETPKRKRRKRKVDYQFNGLSDLSFKEQVVLIKSYLKEKTYPAGCSQSFRRSLRRRTKAFRLDPRSDETLQYGKIEHGLPKPRWLEVIGDPDQQKEILRTTHISSEDGHHYGRDITHKKVTERFYWQTVGQDCINYVRSCTVCQSNAMNRSKESSAVGWSPAKTGKVQFGSGVWKQAGVTILGPYQRTFRDNKYLVVLWDYFTKWPEAQALPYMSSLLIARFIYSVMTRLGWVRITFYDESSELVQEIQDDFCEISRTSQTFHVADRPEDISLDEPYNSSLMEAFATLTKTHPENWDQHIEWALYQYRTSKHPVMGYAPFQLIYGRAPYDPSNTDNCETYEDHVQDAGEKKRALIKDARRILGNARLRHHRRLKRIDETSNQTTQSQDSPPTTQQPQPQPQPQQQQHQQPPTRQQQQQQQQQHQQQQQQQHQALQQPPPRLPVQRLQQQQGTMPRHQHPPQHQQQQPPHQHAQQPPMSQPPAPPPLHQPMAYQHPDHTHMQPQVLSSTYTYMDLPALPCT